MKVLPSTYRARGPVSLTIGLIVALALVVAGPVPAVSATRGDELWVARYSGRFGGAWPTAVAVSPDGTRAFVTGHRSDGDAEAYATVAYEVSTGAEAWASGYSRGFDAGASAIVVSPDGSRVFVTGYVTLESASGTEYGTIAYDAATGEQLWFSFYDGPRDDYEADADSASAIAVSPDGSGVFVTGSSRGSEERESEDYATVAYDAATGTQRWVRRYDGPGVSADAASAIAVSPRGTSVFVTGGSGGDFATVAYDPTTGVKRWVRRYNDPAGASALAVNAGGTRVFVTGSRYAPSGWVHTTIAYAAGPGKTIWVHRHQGRATSLAVNADGTRVFVTGWALGRSDDEDCLTLAYEASTGATVWARRYDGSAHLNDRATAIAVSDGTSVFVTGYSFDGDTDDYLTVAYDAVTGARTWARRYDGPAGSYDEASAIAISRDGASVFVTGSSYGGASTDWEYATIAYAADESDLGDRR